MTSSLVVESRTTVSPMDLVEEMILGQEWAFDRVSEDEMVVEITGRWCDFRLFFSWQEETGTLHFSCAFDVKMPDRFRREINDLLALINQRLWIGHFDVPAEMPAPMFRHTFLVNDPKAFNTALVHNLIEIAVEECERYYPAFQFVIWGGQTPEQAMSAILFDTVGNA